MANFVLLYSGGGAPPASEAEGKAILDAWTKWFTKLGSAVVDSGNPFTPQAKTIASDGMVSDGPMGTASGYSVVKANSMDEAVQLAKGCPHLQVGKVMVFETFNVM